MTKAKRNRQPALYVIGGEKLLPVNKFHLNKIAPKTNNQEKAFHLYAEGFNLVLAGSPGVGKSLLAMYLALAEVMDSRTPYERVVIVRSTVPTRNQGFLPGCQPYHSKVLTPSGWRTMGEILPGDYVISKSGNPVKVLEIFEKGVKSVFQVTTEQGKVTECCADHIWYTTSAEQKKRGKLGSLKTTSEIADTLNGNKVNPGYTNHYLPINGVVEYESPTEVKIPAYTLGVLLGNGHLGDSISFVSIDQQTIDRVRNEVGKLDYQVNMVKNSISYNISSSISKPNKCNGTYCVNDAQYNSIASLCAANPDISKGNLKSRCYGSATVNGNLFSYKKPIRAFTNDIKQALYEYGLLFKKAWEKSIPDEYKYGSIFTRMEILKGLMDTDGTIRKSTGETSYTTTSQKLAFDIQEIVRSLGGRCTFYTRDRIGHTSMFAGREITSRRISYEVCINLNFSPFHLTRKAECWKPSKFVYQDGIKSVKYLYDLPVKCILIDDEDHLYITDDFIVTHNTLEEKQKAYEMPYKGIFRELIDPSITGDAYEKLKAQKSLEFISTSFVRGITIDNAIIVVDEFQNMTAQELDSIITRVGDNCKIIFCGDTRQSDLRDNDKLEHIGFLKILAAMDMFRCIQFGVEDIVRSGMVKQYLTIKDRLGY